MIHPRLLSQVFGKPDLFEHWTPTCTEMKEAVQWSKSNYHMVGDFTSIKAGAMDYLESIYMIRLNNTLTDLKENEPDIYAQYLMAKDETTTN